MSDKVRVLRVIEYVGDRDWVEWQVAQSIHGEKQVDGKYGRGVIKAATVGVYPEVLETSVVEDAFDGVFRKGSSCGGSDRLNEDQGPSYHDVVVFVDGKAYRIADNYSYELTCTRIAGWQLWHNSLFPDNKHPSKLIGGEYDSDDFRIEVGGQIVCGRMKSA